MENKYKNIIHPILLVLFMCLTVKSYAQEASTITVSGIVVDTNNKPLEGVIIERQENSQKVTTGPDGKFALEASPTDIIFFSKPGYITTKVVGNDITDLPVIMEVALIDRGQDDNIYIPFGSRKKRHLTAAISAIEGDDIPQMPLSSLENSLIGLVPGLYISPSSSGPGRDNVSLLIRGRSSYNDDQSPLILVDGIERDLSDMDIREIESISVLKDAASLAWYGMRGANGVILVTTRQGHEGKTTVTLDAMGGVQLPGFYTRPLDSYTYANLYNEGLQNDGLPPLYSAEDLAGYQDGSDPYRYPNNNFVDRFLSKSAPVQRYVATVSGGNAIAKYFTLFSYYNQGGLFAESTTPDYISNNSYKRYNFRSNVDVAVTSDLDISLNIGGRVEDRVEPGPNTGYVGVNNLLNTIFLTPPNAYPLVNEDGSYGGASLFRNNPLAMLQNNGYNSQLTRILLASVNADYKLDGITEGLSASAMYSYDFAGIYTSGQNQNYEVYEQNPVTGEYARFGNRTNLSFRNAAFSEPYRNSELWAGIDYERNFGQHGVNATLRYNNASTFNLGFSRFDYRRNGVSSRTSYNFRNRYMADLVLTYANNPRFAPDKRNGFFPAVSMGWIISDEGFLKETKTLNYLKMRASYGITGSEGLFNTRLYSWKPLYAAGFPGYNFGTSFAYTGAGLGEASLPNEELTFEKSKKFNLGFDAKLFNQSLELTFDYFMDRRTDIIAPAFIPGFIGQTLVPENNGEAQAKGFETSLDYTRQLNKVTLSFFGNFTLATSNLIMYNEQPGLPENQRQVGHPLGNLGLMYKSVGIFQSQEEIDNAPRQTLAGNVQPGDIRYEDINNDGLIDAFDQSTMDYTAIPKAYYGFGTTVKYAGFDLTAMFSGVEGRSVDIRNVIYAGNGDNGFINEYSIDRWTPATASTALWPRVAISDRGNNTAASTFWIRSGDYLQLRNMELGYSLPTNIVNQLKIGACRFYINGYNLFSLTDLKYLNINPLIVDAGRGGNYPYLTTYAGGVNIQF